MNTAATYAEAQGNQPFDWNAFLAKGRRRTKHDWLEAGRLARSWVTCACGNQCTVLERNTWGEPADTELKVLGMDFYDAINDHELKLARLTLVAIEKRTTELLATR